MAQAFHKGLKIIKASAASSRINILSSLWAAASTTLHSDDEFVLGKEKKKKKKSPPEDLLHNLVVSGKEQL